MKNRAVMLRTVGLSLAVVAALGLGGCASTGPGGTTAESEIHDPLESVNRGVFAFNDVLDRAVIAPVARGYRAAVPSPARKGIRNFFRNLKSPVVFANEVLQGDIDGAGTVLFRTTVNTLVGVGGLFDVAGKEGFEYEQEDFGQTLGVWGAGQGPYIVLPVLGPSSVRDTVGLVVDSYLDPVRLYLFNTHNEDWYYGLAAVNGIDKREELLDVLDDLRKSSIDYYAAVRSAYYQRREALVQDENSGSMASPAIPDYDDE